MKKFYKSVAVSSSTKGWEIHLDGKSIKTPSRNALVAPSRRLAEAISLEWAEQGEEISPETMPVTQIMMTTIDRVIPNRKILEDEILNYIDTDLICYFAPEPELYVKAQKEAWNPVLIWIEENFGILPETTSGLSSLKQPEKLHKTITDKVGNLDDPSFSCLYLITKATGSIFLGIAFIFKAFPNEDIFKAALVEDLKKDEIYMADTYGISPDQERNRKRLREDLENCRKFLTLHSQAS